MTPSRPGRRAGAGLWLAGILLLTLAAYIPSLGNGFTNWDDPVYVLENPLLSHPSLVAILTTPVGGNYHPLTMASLVLNHWLSGPDPASYHLLNLMIHLANTAFVFVFVRSLSGGRLWAAAGTSLFFGIHPMHVESVAWIAGRKDVLYAFFYLLGLIAYLLYVDRRRPVWLGATLAAATLSLASKPAAAVFPLALVAIDWYRGRPLHWRVVLEKTPFFALSLAAGSLTLHAQTATGALGAQHSGPSLERVLLALYALATYVARFFTPVRLSAIYPYPGPGGGGSTWDLLPAIAAAVVVPLAVALAWRRDRAALFGIAFFLGNLVLVLPLYALGNTFMADRYTYLPYVGLAFALFSRWDRPPSRTRAAAALRRVLVGCVALAIPIFFAMTWVRCGVWRDSETLWSDAIRKYPHRVFAAYANRAHYRIDTGGRPDAALTDFDEALALNAGYPEVWAGRGLALAELGRMDAAFASFDHALALAPDFLPALNNRGVMRMRSGDLAGAVADFSRSIELNPLRRDLYANRAVAYAAMEQYERSIADYSEAIRMAPGGDPAGAEYYLGRSRAWRALGDRERALKDAIEARRLGAEVDPGYIKEVGG